MVEENRSLSRPKRESASTANLSLQKEEAKEMIVAQL